MARVKLKFPSENHLFATSISVRISDVNYGNHLGNDGVLSLMHEARMRWLGSRGYDELNAAGTGLIMADVMIAYRGEAFYGEELFIRLYADELTDRSFDLLYRITTVRNGAVKDIADAKTGMICFDYGKRKIGVMTAGLREMLGQGPVI